ncbi:MAG TPA: HD-GYP domain-containing protein [Gaiella sp.]|nr:HD-GYP domain-containing protein [Gaiella sp.]
MADSGAVLAEPASALELEGERNVLIEERRARAPRPLAARDSVVTSASAVVFLALALALQLGFESARSPGPELYALLVFAYAFASRVEFEVGIGSAIPTQLVFVPMLFLLPSGAVPICVAAGLLLGNVPAYLRGREHVERALVAVASSWHALGAALVLALAGEPEPTWSAWPVLLLAFAAQLAFDFAGSALRAGLVLGLPPTSQVRMMAWVWGVDAALTPIAFLIAIVAVGTPAALLVAVPLVALLAFLAQERRRRIDYALELGHAYRGTAFLLGDVIEADDAYTGSHSRDVVDLVVAVSLELGLDPAAQRDAELTALLHDVGKIRIPAEIINKPGKLTDGEWAVMKTHTIEGERMLEKIGGLLGRVGRLVRSCHERWDGGGYPDGLAGEEIPLVARVVCACDAYNAMTTDRPYRAARSADEALAEVRACAGTHFDPAVVAALELVVSVGRG